jgi:hypothetical protein
MSVFCSNMPISATGVRMFKHVSPKLDIKALEEGILKFWKSQKIFEKTISERRGAPEYVFFEGPPTANGLPAVHHVEARVQRSLPALQDHEWFSGIPAGRLGYAWIAG